MSSDSISPLLSMIAFGGMIWWLLRHLFKVQNTDGFFTHDGVQYRYVIGNMLMNEANASNFNGIILELPKRLPHVYIDGHANEKMRGPRYTYPAANKLSLEGNFDHSFQVYGLPRYHSLILSILTPDVMATLVDLLPRYDIEIVGNQLSIISRDKVYGHSDREAAVTAALQHIAPEILHRLKSWSDSDARSAGTLIMKGQPYDIVKFGRTAVSTMQIIGAVLFAIPGLGIIAIAAALWSQPYPINHEVMPWVMGFGFLIFPCAWLIYILIDRNKLPW